MVDRELSAGVHHIRWLVMEKCDCGAVILLLHTKSMHFLDYSRTAYSTVSPRFAVQFKCRIRAADSYSHLAAFPGKATDDGHTITIAAVLFWTIPHRPNNLVVHRMKPLASNQGNRLNSRRRLRTFSTRQYNSQAHKLLVRVH